MKKFIVLFFCSLVITSCLFDNDKSNNDDPTAVDEFGFTINVQDPNGNPVPDLNVLLLNKISYTPWGEFQWLKRSQTIIPFSIVGNYYVEIAIKDIENNIVKTLLADNLESGWHAVWWNGKNEIDEDVQNGIYYCSMKAFEDSIITYESEIMMLMMSFAEINRNGSTDLNGSFSTTQTASFLNLYNLPDVVLTDENGCFCGSTAISDTTAICLFDPDDRDICQFEYRVIGSKKNIYNIIWEPDTLRVNSIYNERNKRFVLQNQNSISRPLENELEQNYPNPFN